MFTRDDAVDLGVPVKSVAKHVHHEQSRGNMIFMNEKYHEWKRNESAWGRHVDFGQYKV